MSRLFLVLALVFGSAEAFAPGSAVARSAVRAANVQMSTQFTDPFVQKMKKKNPKTGSTTNLKGYTVGSRAPKVSVSSGTRTTGYKTDGALRGVDKNTQNVPTGVVLGLPIAGIALVKFLGQVWG